ncbi:MAG: pyridoxal phosphate-dependent aminotransferase [Pseudomonadota bacterium]|nr:pyridoxal phosphate-dependent aminotransferase [Pseudomonadota bacterium]
MDYALWIRQTIDRLRRQPRDAWALFDSSVPEPETLLSETIDNAFGHDITSRYTSAFVNGNPYAVAALARRYDVPRDRIISTTGATEGLHTVYRALLEAGDHVLIETPHFELFDSLAHSNGLAVDHFPRRAPDFAIDMDAFEAALTPRTRMVVVSDLHNPSSEPLPPEQLERLTQLADQRGFWLVVDEVYRDYGPAATRTSVAATRSPNVITISSLTKIYGLSSVRCGWIIASGDTLASLRAFNDRYAFGVSKLGHAVAALVLENPEPFDAYVRDLIEQARPVIARYYDLWQAEKLVEGRLPAHGCISFPRLVGIEDTHAFSDWLMTHCDVIVAPGELFGMPGHVRIGHAQPADRLEAGLSLLTHGLRDYRARQVREAI